MPTIDATVPLGALDKTTPRPQPALHMSPPVDDRFTDQLPDRGHAMAVPTLKPPTQLQGITDLTVIADIREGLVRNVFESRSYRWRLEQVLKLLDAARRTRREADVMPSPFIDGVARLRGVHFFRFAVLPDSDKLLLNVTFDGGWETYIRLIWGPLGTMLDLIFCHCVDYPLAATSTFEDYVSWVREHEVPSQFFYADSPGTVADRAYLNRLEAQWRAGGESAGADVRAARLALENERDPQPTRPAVLEALTSLRALYGLTSFFGTPGTEHGDVLLRFAQDFLPDLREWYARGLLDAEPEFDALRKSFEKERDWLTQPRWSRPERQDQLLPLKPESLQAGILDSPKAPAGFARGALVLLRVVDAEQARNWLAAGWVSDGGTKSLTPQEVVCTVAITCAGLPALGVHERYLTSLPAEFRQGMEARAGLLGDLRVNHPQQWNRPPSWNGGAAPGLPIDLAMVHVIVQLRTAEAVAEQKTDRAVLLPRLKKWIDTQPGNGFQVLAVEAAWSRPIKDGEPSARDHFNYVDGVSQPVLTPSVGSVFWDDAVKAGEVVLGCVNDRGDGPIVDSMGRLLPGSPPWLDLCTFVVIRKIRQNVEAFDAIVEKAAAALVSAGIATPLQSARELVRAKLMGRGSDGTPLVAQRGDGYNDFDFRKDVDGGQCPFASHVRRANPRAALAGARSPRILRRGMSYGPSEAGSKERGVLFMAYNASIAEQFEVIQRWLTGGNSSGVSSSHTDPLLGVPRPGEPGIFSFVHGNNVVRVDMGDKPFCELQWGLYALVPSIDWLKSIGQLLADPGAPKKPDRAPVAPDPKESVKAEFEDELRRPAAWKRVRDESSGVEKIGSTVMVGRFDAIAQVLEDDGSTYSVSGYGERMAATVGSSPFGEDDDVPNAGHDRPFVRDVKAAIADAVSEAQAYATAFGFVERYLEKKVLGSRSLGMNVASVDVVDVGIQLIAHLCQEWFGVSYGDGVAEIGTLDPKPQPVRCPGHFLAMARYVFSAYPNPTVKALAAGQATAAGQAPDAEEAPGAGQAAIGPHAAALRKAVTEWMAAPSANSAPVMKAVLGALERHDVGRDDRRGTVANVMLGLPATLLGSWVKVVTMCAANGSLWRLQYGLLNNAQRVDYRVTADRDPRAACTAASGVLRNALILTMAANPVADGIWRTVTKRAELGPVEVQPDDTVWLGMGAALMDKPGDVDASEKLLFGGAIGIAPHACPGRGLAIGAMLGALAALLLAGEWSATPNPTTFRLKAVES